MVNERLERKDQEESAKRPRHRLRLIVPHATWDWPHCYLPVGEGILSLKGKLVCEILLSDPEVKGELFLKRREGNYS